MPEQPSTFSWRNIRDRRLRRVFASQVFGEIFPGLRSWRREKLVNLALSYWERPDRYR